MQAQVSIVRWIAKLITYLDLFLQSKYYFLNPDKNVLFSDNPFSFSEFFSFSGRLKAKDFEFSFWYLHSDGSLFDFSVFFDIPFRGDLRKRLLDLTNALLVFLFCLMRSWMESGILVFDLMVSSGRWLWTLMMVSVRMFVALLMMLMRSRFSEEIRLEIWCWRTANCLGREKVIESQLVLW